MYRNLLVLTTEPTKVEGPPFVHLVLERLVTVALVTNRECDPLRADSQSRGTGAHAMKACRGSLGLDRKVLYLPITFTSGRGTCAAHAV